MAMRGSGAARSSLSRKRNRLPSLSRARHKTDSPPSACALTGAGSTIGRHTIAHKSGQVTKVLVPLPIPEWNFAGPQKIPIRRSANGANIRLLSNTVQIRARCRGKHRLLQRCWFCKSLGNTSVSHSPTATDPKEGSSGGIHADHVPPIAVRLRDNHHSSLSARIRAARRELVSAKPKLCNPGDRNPECLPAHRAYKYGQ